MKIKKGDFVVRKSYNKDLLFEIIDIIEVNQKKIAILHGVIKRIQANSYIDDLVKVPIKLATQKIMQHEEKTKRIIENIDKRAKEKLIKGKILHLDGDRRYSEKSYRHYRKMGLNAIVRNIKESMQPRMVTSLIKAYNPDILVITGHDGIIKKNSSYYDINNYRNSKYFVNAVLEARKYDPQNNLAIIAGACQSYYEALILAGANFASSPGRILIEFTDPLIVAETIATTQRNSIITINDIETKLKDGKMGINGIPTLGKMRLI